MAREATSAHRVAQMNASAHLHLIFVVIVQGESLQVERLRLEFLRAVGGKMYLRAYARPEANSRSELSKLRGGV